MKSTTFQQKIILSAKVFACALILGVLGWLSFAPKVSVGAADVVISVEVSYNEPWIQIDNVSDTGNTIQITGDSENINYIIDVFLDKNKNGVFDGDDVILDGSVIIGDDGSVAGSVDMPSRLPSGEYALVVVGHTANTSGGDYRDTASGSFTVNYINDGPLISCIHNEGAPCTPNFPTDGGQGSVNGGTIIVIEGDNFADDTVVYVGDQKCTKIEISDDGKTVMCTVPPAENGKAGPQDVKVCTKGGTRCDTMRNGFIYEELPLAGIPNTGLFRIGDSVVTTKDLMWWGGLVIIVAATAMLLIIVAKTPKNAHYSVKSGSNKKRNYRKQKVAFSSNKKVPKRK